MSLTIAWRDKLEFGENPQSADFDRFSAFVVGWVEKTGDGRKVNDQIEMLGILSQVENIKSKRISSTDKATGVEKSLAWLARATGLLELLPEGRERMAALADVQFRSADAHTTADEFAAAISSLDLAHSLFSQVDMKRQATKAQQKKALILQLWIYEAYLLKAVPPGDVDTVLNNMLGD
ncbi:hypothetical protein OQA88_11793 [Cercophora sp. LCS_1]